MGKKNRRGRGGKTRGHRVEKGKSREGSFGLVRFGAKRGTLGRNWASAKKKLPFGRGERASRKIRAEPYRALKISETPHLEDINFHKEKTSEQKAKGKQQKWQT